MKAGDLGMVVSAAGDEWNNPLGMSLQVLDTELLAELLHAKAQAPNMIEVLAGFDAGEISDVQVLEFLGDVNDTVTDVGRRIATRHARAALRRAGLDIADRPISVEPVESLPLSTKWHVLTIIVPLPDDETTADG